VHEGARPPETGTTEAPKTDAEIAALVHEALPLVGPVAKQLARQLGAFGETEELEAVGRAALVEIAHDFDPVRGLFTAFARSRLRWAMLDSVRRETHGRMFSSRALALAASERIARETTSEPPDPQLDGDGHARRLRGVIAAQAAAMVTALCAPFADEGTGTGERPVAPRQGRPAHDPGPEDVVLRARQAAALRTAVEALEPRHRDIVERHYFGGERFDHIAESLGVSKSWLSRLHAQAIEKLAKSMKDYGDG
jgi:RNA polymerase sigma factor for flagellar operon FliA